MDKELPKSAVLTTEQLDPTRMLERKDRADPKFTKSNTETIAPP
jgi:hypothetical protein